MIPASRYDVIVDFSKVTPGTTIFLYNDAVGPWPGGGGNVLNEIMSFTVGPVITADTTVIPAHPDPAFAPLPMPVKTEYITLNEWIDTATASSQSVAKCVGKPVRVGQSICLRFGQCESRRGLQQYVGLDGCGVSTSTKDAD